MSLETLGVDPPSFKTYVAARKHGTRHVYQSIRCRCEKCRAWNAELSRRLRARKRVAPRSSPLVVGAEYPTATEPGEGNPSQGMDVVGGDAS